ncbi:high affinity copper uptake protein 1-like [Pomacea canaliculata]|uniref:high affinity copper uptake protein 1-like n=1 Tax=Pomacea canaliculata TaxID=400727 RepID=UPI000D7391E0|nr:high affinity copper uptake protein 1-like [Pomacea canaliculata]
MLFRSIPLRKITLTDEFSRRSRVNPLNLSSLVQVCPNSDLAGACIVIFIAALVHEGLRLLVNWLQMFSATRPPRKMVRLGILGLTQTGAYVVYLSLSYCLMLVFMTMNIWFCLALLLGAGTGYLLFFFHPVANRLLNSLRRHQDKYEDMKSEVTTIYGSNEKQADNIALGNVGSCH